MCSCAQNCAKDGGNGFSIYFQVQNQCSFLYGSVLDDSIDRNLPKRLILRWHLPLLINKYYYLCCNSGNISFMLIICDIHKNELLSQILDTNCELWSIRSKFIVFHKGLDIKANSYKSKQHFTHTSMHVENCIAIKYRDIKKLIFKKTFYLIHCSQIYNYDFIRGTN